MEIEKLTTGLMIEAGVKHGSWQVMVHVMQRRDDDKHPINPHNAYGASGLEDLGMQAHISDYSGHFYVDSPEYHNAYRIGARRAKAMLDTLTKINKAMVKADAQEIGDMFMVFAKAIGATWWVERQDASRSMYSDNTWRFRPLTDGREALRGICATEIEAERVRRGEKAA